MKLWERIAEAVGGLIVVAGLALLIKKVIDAVREDQRLTERYEAYRRRHPGGDLYHEKGYLDDEDDETWNYTDLDLSSLLDEDYDPDYDGLQPISLDP